MGIGARQKVVKVVKVAEKKEKVGQKGTRKTQIKHHNYNQFKMITIKMR